MVYLLDLKCWLAAVADRWCYGWGRQLLGYRRVLVAVRRTLVVPRQGHVRPCMYWLRPSISAAGSMSGPCRPYILCRIYNMLCDKKWSYFMVWSDHKLTQLLRESLGGATSNTCAIIHLSPALSAYSDTLQVLQLASRMHQTRLRRRSKVSTTFQTFGV